MIPFWEMYSASENTTEPLPNASGSSNQKSEFQSDTKQHNFTWIRRLSPIIGISILGVASSCFGYYTAQNQFIIAQKPPGTIVWPIPGIGKVKVYKQGSSSEKCVKEENKTKDCFPIEDNIALVVNPKRAGNKMRDNKSYYTFKVIECADQTVNRTDCDRNVKNKFVEGTFLVCEQGCGVNINDQAFTSKFLGEVASAKNVANNLISQWSGNKVFYRARLKKPRNTAW